MKLNTILVIDFNESIEVILPHIAEDVIFNKDGDCYENVFFDDYFTDAFTKIGTKENPQYLYSNKIHEKITPELNSYPYRPMNMKNLGTDINQG